MFMVLLLSNILSTVKGLDNRLAKIWTKIANHRQHRVKRFHVQAISPALLPDFMERKPVGVSIQIVNIPVRDDAPQFVRVSHPLPLLRFLATGWDFGRPRPGRSWLSLWR
jgi:hypothetical protein